MLASLGQSLSADGAREVDLVAQHREETVPLGLHASPLAAEEPADQRDEMEHPSTAEMTCIRDMSGAQFEVIFRYFQIHRFLLTRKISRPKVGRELWRSPVKRRDNPGTYAWVSIHQFI
jgi:hypothetical protein